MRVMKLMCVRGMRGRPILPERDLRLLELARELHLARLEEYPRNLSDALERREAHEAARRAWLEDQARFEEPPACGWCAPRTAG